jgi:4,4'-diaponeurosporenoate glycosyltransferase
VVEIGVMLIVAFLSRSSIDMVSRCVVDAPGSTQARFTRRGQAGFAHTGVDGLATPAWSGKSETVVDLVVFALGWSCGWLLLWTTRPLPGATDRPRSSVAVVIPARNEAASLPHLLPVLVAQLGPDDELVVVDDHSSDDTARIAADLGASVLQPPELPDGWLGKPHACWQGATSTAAETLLFLDADVRPAGDLVDRIATTVDAFPGDVVSVQPWHVTERPSEQFSLLCNITALMGSGAFAPGTGRRRTTVAFGPVLGLRRDVYDRIGGHADPTIRTMHTEDIGIARAVGSARLYTGRPDTAFRMYPDGLRQLIAGWTRSIATGARYTPWWSVVATLAWVASLAGGWLVEPLLYPVSAAQLWVLGRRAGSMRVLTAVLYPLALVVFVWIFLRSAVTMLLGRQVAWKGRSVDARPR